jgi:hypothetical protein
MSSFVESVPMFKWVFCLMGFLNVVEQKGEVFKPNGMKKLEELETRRPLSGNLPVESQVSHDDA